MKFILESHSLLLPSSGVANVIDDVAYQSDSKGVPFIPGKTLKGLVREAAENLADLFVASQPSFPKNQLIKYLFGFTGIEEGIIFFPNLYLKQVGNHVIDLEKDGQEFDALVSVTRNQTAIEKDIAKEGSLRKYRLIKKGSRFEGDSNTKLSVNAKLFLQLSCLLVERMGVRRNRGWGNISINIDAKLADPQVAFDALKNIKDVNDFSDPASNTANDEVTDYFQKENNIFLLITAKSPLIMSVVDRSSFNVDSKSYLPGRSIRGILAAHYIKKQKESNIAYNPINDAVFRSLFLEKKITFGNAIICNGKSQFDCVPNNIVYSKYGDRSNAKDQFKEARLKTSDKYEKTKNISEYGRTSNGKLQLIKVRKNNHFHQERGRFSGRNKDGKIFYYESINENQTFISIIEGASPDFKIKLIPENAHIGRSRSAQYGQITIKTFIPEIVADQEVQNFKSNIWTIFAASPLILMSDTGIYDPNLLDKCIATILPGCTIENRAVKFSTERLYQPQWSTYDNLIPCIAIGSSFEVKFPQELRWEELEGKINEGIGLYLELGFGQLRAWKYETDHVKVESLGKKEDAKVIRPDKNKEDALKKSEELYKKGKLTNSLSGGMIQELMKLKDGEILDWIDHTKNLFLKKSKTWEDFDKGNAKVLKPAAIRINDAGILNDIRNLKSDNEQKYTIEFWIKTFKYLQKRNSYGKK